MAEDDVDIGNGVFEAELAESIGKLGLCDGHRAVLIDAAEKVYHRRRRLAKRLKEERNAVVLHVDLSGGVRLKLLKPAAHL